LPSIARLYRESFVPFPSGNDEPIEHRRLAPGSPAGQNLNVAFRPGRRAPLHLALQIVDLTLPTVDLVALPLYSLIVISDPVVLFSFEAGNIGFVIANRARDILDFSGDFVIFS
jgi:hypothetical protein